MHCWAKSTMERPSKVDRVHGLRPRAPCASAWALTPCAYLQPSSVKQGSSKKRRKVLPATECRGLPVELSPKTVLKKENRRP